MASETYQLCSKVINRHVISISLRAELKELISTKLDIEQSQMYLKKTKAQDGSYACILQAQIHIQVERFERHARLVRTIAKEMQTLSGRSAC